jgi:hypothetical protein
LGLTDDFRTLAELCRYSQELRLVNKNKYQNKDKKALSIKQSFMKGFAGAGLSAPSL